MATLYSPYIRSAARGMALSLSGCDEADHTSAEGVGQHAGDTHDATGRVEKMHLLLADDLAEGLPLEMDMDIQVLCFNVIATRNPNRPHVAYSTITAKNHSTKKSQNFRKCGHAKSSTYRITQNLPRSAPTSSVNLEMP